jgi:hypothetical protein
MAPLRNARYVGSLLSLALAVVVALVAPVACVCPGDPHAGQTVHPLFAHTHPDAPQPADEPVASASALQGSSLVYAQSPALAGQVLLDREALSLEQEVDGRLATLLFLQPSSAFGSIADPPPRVA